jgi:hypothetical protein
MFNLGTKLLLTFSVFACPLGCQIRVCCADDTPQVEREEAACPSCPSCAKDDESQDSESHPSHPAPCEQPCQCLCGGAVILLGAIDLKPKFDHSIDSVAICVPTPADELIRHEAGNVCSLHTGATPGRVIRCLHMSFLC